MSQSDLIVIGENIETFLNNIGVYSCIKKDLSESMSSPSARPCEFIEQSKEAVPLICFFGKKAVNVDDEIWIELELTGLTKLNVYVVNRFEISYISNAKNETLPDMCLNGTDLLLHYGKYLAGTPSNITNESLNFYWRIRYPEEVEALLRRYDNLAKIFGKPTLFNLP
jgi:hypothetical protein